MKKNKYIFIIIGLGLLIYFNSLFNNFVWDDEEQILNNQLIHSVRNVSLFFKGGTFNTGGSGNMMGIYYKPIMSICFSILYSLFGPRPFFFHSFQLIIHIINTVLVFYILKKLINNKPIAFFMSLLFLVHPINTESVVYISALQDVLFFFFGMLAFLIVVYKDKLRFPEFAFIFFCLFLSLLSKETGIIFLPIIFFYLFLFNKKQLLLLLNIFIFLIGTYFILRFGLANVGLTKFGISPISRANLATRLITIPKVITFYLKTFFFPKNLSILQHWLVKQINFLDFYIPFAFNIIFLILVLFFYIKNHSKTFLFFLLWLIFGLSLHLHIFPLDMTVAERWFYLPMVGILGILGVVIQNLKFKIFNLKLILILIIITLSIRTFMRTFDWRNGFTLYGHDIKITRGAFDLENNYGVELFRNNHIKESRKYFENSTRLAPYWWVNWNNLGAAVEQENNLTLAKKYYMNSMKNGDYYLAYQNYVRILIKENRTTEAKNFLTKVALVKFPQNPELIRFYNLIQKN